MKPGHYLKKGRLVTNRPPRPTRTRSFTKTAHGRAHGLKVIDRGPGSGHLRDPAAPELVICPGLSFRPCGRAVNADMMVPYARGWICDGCATLLDRHGLLVDDLIDLEPGGTEGET